MPKEYLGDSVYVDIKKGQLVLTTENGGTADPSNRIYMEYPVLLALFNYLKNNGVTFD